MTDTRSIFVPGTPAPQGSKSFKGFRGGRGVLIESSKAVGPWRERVAFAAHTHDNTGPWDCAVTLDLAFVMPRPKSTPKRSTPPAIRRPDLDKLIRAICDALTDVWITDDSRIVDLHASKRIAELGETPGAHITLEPRIEITITTSKEASRETPSPTDTADRTAKCH